MPVPSNYNSSSIDVDPWPMKSASSAVADAVSGISDAMAAITDKLDELRLSWVGPSSDEADKFNNDWNDLGKRLYGTKDDPYGKDDPRSGILNRFNSGLATASVGYSRGERAVSDSFAAYEAALEGWDTRAWGLPADADLEDALANPPMNVAHGMAKISAWKALHPEDYTDHAPAENTVIDGPEAYANAAAEVGALSAVGQANGIDLSGLGGFLPDPNVHTTSVDETF